MQFLTFFVNTIKAVYEHADLLRASIASANNDHRLGANEAPPAIMSAFLGDQLSKVLDDLEASVSEKKMTPEQKTALKMGIGKIPDILLDNTDRNRTSPFAFTGNKFEFRAVGSSANSSNAMLALNVIVANQLTEFKKEVDALIEKGEKKDEAILKVLRQYIVDSKNIRFEGNGYSDEWVKEAKKRGLNNITTTPAALDAYVSKKSLKLFEENNIFSHREAEARHEIMLETYVKKIQIEARVIGDLAINHIVPPAVKYQTELAVNVRALKEIGTKQGVLPGDVAAMAGGTSIFGEEVFSSQIEMITEISEHITSIRKNVNEMIEERKKANRIENIRDKAIAYCDNVRPYFDKIRHHADKLELLVDDEMWPMTKYRELVTIR